MCGIAGVFLNSGTVSKARLDAAAKSMLHRGPDGHGQYIHDAIGLVPYPSLYY